ncbi:MAG: hypothetical protein V4563_18165 [Pseudomonadota bacterium]
MGAKFELNYHHEASYDDRVVVEIKLQRRPGAENYKKMLSAIDTLNTIALMYVKIPEPVKEKK